MARVRRTALGAAQRLELSFGTEAIKYLFAVNAGAVVGLLAYLGATKPSPIPPAFLWMLGCFVLGVVLVGLVHAARFHGAARLLRGWKRDVREFYGDRITWAALLDRDEERVSAFPWDVALAWGAFACFLAGGTIGLRVLI